MDDATIRFDFRASTPATPTPGRGVEARGGDGEEQLRVEPEKYDEKGDFEGWVNQFEEYATLGQWNEEEKASLLFLSLTAGARMYFVGLPEGRISCTLPGSKPSAVGLDRKGTPASLYRSWPNLGEGRTSRPRSWLIVQGVWPAGLITQTITQVKRRRRYMLSKRRW